MQKVYQGTTTETRNTKHFTLFRVVLGSQSTYQHNFLKVSWRIERPEEINIDMERALD